MSVTYAPEKGTEQRDNLLTRGKNFLDAHLTKLPTAAAVLLFISMIIYGEATYGKIVQYSTLSNLLINNSHLIIMAVGVRLPFLTGGGGDVVSVGSIFLFSSLSGVMLANSGMHAGLVILLMILIGSGVAR